MMRTIPLIILAVIMLTIPLSAQNPPVWVTVFDTVRVTEGVTTHLLLEITDLDEEDTHYIYMIPNENDPIFKDSADFTAGQDLKTKDFLFTPDYNFITAGPDTIPVTFYATDNIDTISMDVIIIVTNNNPRALLDDIPDNFRIVEGVLFTIPVIATDPEGIYPVLETSPLPANAGFVDSLNGRGLFSFTPDETQYGTGEQDTIVRFYARDPDTDSTDEEVVTITVVGPNEAPSIDSIDAQTVTAADTLSFTVIEGDSLIFTVVASDPNATFPTLTFSVFLDSASYDTMGLLDSMSYNTPGDGTGLFVFTPDYRRSNDSIHYVTFKAFDGEFEDIATVEIIINDAGNQPPAFRDLPLISGYESGSDTCLIPVSDYIYAFDPEGGAVQFIMQDELLHSTLEAIDDTTALFSFCPYCDQGGSYQLLIRILDDSLETNPGEDSADLIIEISETNPPPNLFVNPGGSQSLNEGDRLRIDWQAYDTPGDTIQFEISPSADSAIFKGALESYDFVDSGYIEFAPDYNFAPDGGSEVIALKFLAADDCETVIEERVITVYDVGQDANDPLEADTLILMNTMWDDSLGGFKFRTRIWNDSAVAAAMTGFRWYNPWLELDTVIFDTTNFNQERLQDSLFLNYYVNSDSMNFLITFIFFDSLYLDTGLSEYFTAYFKYKTTHSEYEDSSFSYDTAKVGSSGEFFFDKRVRGAPPANIKDDGLFLSLKSEYTYKPLVKRGEVRAPSNRVKMEIFDVEDKVALGKGSVLYTRNAAHEQKLYEMRLLVENQNLLTRMILDFQIASRNNSASWTYQDPSIMTVPFSRMYPDSDIWPTSPGLQLIGPEIDGLGTDSLRIFGMADIDSGGLPPGLLEYMVTIPFTIDDVTSDRDTMKFDRGPAGSPEMWYFFDPGSSSPTFSGGLELPVVFSPTITNDRIVLEIYDLTAGTVLDEDDVLYVQDNQGNPKRYELRIKCENKWRLAEMSLDFKIYNETQDVFWTYGDTLLTVDSTSRMYPDSIVWANTSGLQFDSSSMDGMAADSFRISGTAEPDTLAYGLPPDSLEVMVKIPFTIRDVTGDQALLCFDTAAYDVPGTWFFTDTLGQMFYPAFEGICFPVAFSPTITTDIVSLEIFDVGEGITLDTVSNLYIRDSLDITKQYELRFQIENKRKLADLSLDFRIYAENEDVIWAYQDPVILVDSISRMFPDTVTWPLSDGLQFVSYSLDGMAADSFRIFGNADTTSGGLAPGRLQKMMTIPFAIQDVTSGQAILCFDTGAAEVPGTWYFVDMAEQLSAPVFKGDLCFPVYYNPVVDVDEEPPPLPGTYSLSQNYPNPFNPSTTIHFSLARREKVTITVFNILGQVVTTLTDRVYDSGIHTVDWDGRDRHGRSTASGIYLYHMSSEGLTTTRKMILLR